MMCFLKEKALTNVNALIYLDSGLDPYFKVSCWLLKER